ncbi:MAG: hypothetical protein ACOVSW_18060 [Candidatus Kapaibacteriota bacterium]
MPETLRLRAIHPSDDNTSLQVDIEALGIPLPAVQRELDSLQGALVLRYGYQVCNPFNGMIDFMPVRRMWANIRTTFVHNKTRDDDDTNAHRSFIKWLRSYVSEATLPEKLLDTNAVTRPIIKQVRKPFMHTLLSAETLRNPSCEVIGGECPVRGSMTTEYRTLYDYCTMKTRQGKFIDRTKELLIQQER